MQVLPCHTRRHPRKVFFYSDHISRTKEDHGLQCAGILNPDLQQHWARLHGIKSNCVLNSLRGFHVVGGCVPDLMHDILEGVLSVSICALLAYCIFTKKYFSLKELNNVIENFQYGVMESRDKPSKIELIHLKFSFSKRGDVKSIPKKLSKKLKQSARQLWLLGVNLPLLVGKKVPETDLTWCCFTTLLEICRLIFLSYISEFPLLQLESLIDEFLSGVKNYFELDIIPKMHHLVDYPRIIRDIGPLGAYWCMRYEAKHSYFKQLQRRIRNYINIPFTLSLRHQQWQCHQFLIAGKEFLKFEISVKSNSTECSLSSVKCAG